MKKADEALYQAKKEEGTDLFLHKIIPFILLFPGLALGSPFKIQLINQNMEKLENYAVALYPEKTKKWGQGKKLFNQAERQSLSAKG